MPIPIRTRDDILRDLRYDLDSLNSNINFSDHTVPYDVSLFPASVLGERLYILADFVQRTRTLSGIAQIINDSAYKEKIQVALGFQKVQDIETLLSSLLDALAGSWGVTRRSASKANAVVRFYAASNAPITIAKSQRVSTRGGSSVSFVTTSSVTSVVPTFDSALGLYYVELMCQAELSGAAGNVSVGRITTIVGTISGIIQCSNPIASYGGADAESNADLILRAGSAWVSRSLDTVLGLTSLIEGQPLVDDAYVAKTSDPLVNRDQRGMPIDIFVSVVPQPVTAVDYITVGEALAQQASSTSGLGEITYPPSTANTVNYVFNNQPVTDLDSVSVTGGSACMAVPVQDVSDSMSGSTEARSYVQINISGLLLTSTLAITYKYNSAIQSLQNVLDSPSHSLLSHDVLIRDGYEAVIDISLSVVVFVGSGYSDLVTIKTTIESDLTKFFGGGVSSLNHLYSRYKLGQRVDYSDIYSVISNVYGVDRISSFQVTVDGTVLVANGSVNLPNSTYARLGTVTWL